MINKIQSNFKRRVLHFLSGIDINNFSDQRNDFDALIFTQREYFTKEEMIKLLCDIYSSYQFDEPANDLLDDFVNRLVGYCSPSAFILW